MDPGLIAIFFICASLLLALLGLARLANSVLRKPLVNGAAFFFWLLLGAIVGTFAYQWSLPHVTERMAYYAGKSLATVLPLLILSFYLGRRFRRRRTETQTNREAPDA